FLDGVDPSRFQFGALSFARYSPPQSRGRKHPRRHRRDLPSSAQLKWSTQARALSARNEFSHKLGPGWASHIPMRSSSRTSPLSTRLARFKTFAFSLSPKAMD